MREKRLTRPLTVFMAIALLLLAAMLCGCSQLQATNHTADDLTEATVVRVVDGDTLIANVNGADERIRLIGIDTPESVNPDDSKNTEKGREASAYVKDMLKPGTKLWLEPDTEDRDKYDRLLRYVWLDKPSDPQSAEEAKGKMLNAVLVADGWAEPMRIEPNVKWCPLFEELATSK